MPRVDGTSATAAADHLPAGEELSMEIRTYLPGDEAAQVSIYNEAAADLPRFKPATLDEIRRRAHAADYDRTAHLLALEGGQPVGYAGFQTNGRVSYPWCRKGHEAAAQPLFDAVLQAMKARRIARAFAAYRADWPAQQAFFQINGFQPRRELVNFALDLVEMPTPMARASSTIRPATPADVPAILQLGANVLHVRDADALESYLFHNPYFPADSVFVLRGRTDGAPLAVGVVVSNPAYAHPLQVDAAMPCFRLGAFGTEGMHTKRINGLFSFLAAEGHNAHPFGLDLLGFAAHKVRDTDIETFAAQVPSDAGHLLRFYKQYFQRQASFPVLERIL
jgi:hypothetical protein